MTFLDWCVCLERLSEIGCRSVQFIGGEPTLFPDLPRLLDRAAELGFDTIGLFTNGTRIYAELLASIMRSNARIFISIHGSSEIEHDNFVGLNGAYRKVYSNLLELSRNKVEFFLCSNLQDAQTRANNNWEASQFSSQIGAKGFFFAPVLPVGRGNSNTLNQRDRCGHCGNGKICIRWDRKIYDCALNRSVPLCSFDEWSEQMPVKQLRPEIFSNLVDEG